MDHPTINQSSSIIILEEKSKERSLRQHQTLKGEDCVLRSFVKWVNV